MLELENVEITYNDVILAIKGVSLKVMGGQIVALLGANGAGKSSILKAISGVLDSQDGEIERGSILYDNQRIDKWSAAKIVAAGICHVPEGRRIFSDLTIHENLLMGAFLRRDRNSIKHDIEKILDYFPKLTERMDDISGYLSGGEQQMLSIGRALMSCPRLLMLDEPSLGLAPIVVQNIFEIIQRINREESISILLVEQNASMALHIADHGYILENGRMVMDDACEKLIKNEDVMEFYLGIKEDGGEKSFADVKHYKRRKRWLS